MKRLDRDYSSDPERYRELDRKPMRQPWNWRLIGIVAGLLAAPILLAIIAAFSAKNKRPRAVTNAGEITPQQEPKLRTVAPVTKLTWPYKFIEAKSEKNGRTTDRMELYSYDGKIEPDNLSSFCRAKKEASTNDGFFFVVIFDSRENADWPKNPIGAEFGDLDGNPQKHIRAIYCYRRSNGYSELRYHEINIWNHKSIHLKI